MARRALFFCACAAVGAAAGGSLGLVALAGEAMDMEPIVPGIESESVIASSSTNVATAGSPGAVEEVAVGAKTSAVLPEGQTLDALSMGDDDALAEALRQIEGDVADDGAGLQFREGRRNVEVASRVDIRRRVPLLQAIGAFVLASTVYKTIRERWRRHRLGDEATSPPEHSLVKAGLAALGLFLSLIGREPVATFRYRHVKMRQRRPPSEVTTSTPAP